VVTPGGDAQGRRYPCVLKPLHLSGSRGVIRADNDRDFDAACARIREISRAPEILVEDYIPGREFALEGIVTDGRLQVLAIFDKPDPLEGPFFEETIYLTPSAETAATRQAMEAAAQDAVRALGLTYGPVHAEMRINERGVWVLEAAARPIGGLCSRVLRFDGDVTLEELLLRHALGRDVSHLKLAHGARGVMMIPIPRAGIYTGASGRASPGSFLSAISHLAGTADLKIMRKM
jgi:biotin carboxylase